MTTMTKRPGAKARGAKAPAKPAAKAAAGRKTHAEIRVRLDAKVKARAEKLFRRQGLSTGDGVRLLIDRAVAEDDPWHAHNTSSHIPNAETRKAIEECRAGKDEVIGRDDLRKLIFSDLRRKSARRRSSTVK